MMKRILLILCASSTFLLSGCFGTFPIKITDYSGPRSMQPTDPLPTPEQIEIGKSKVVIFAPDESGLELASKAKVGHSIETALVQFISVTGSEIVDRGIPKKLKQELQLAEMKGSSSYEGPNVADYAITGKVSTVNAGAKFTEASQWTDNKGEVHYISAKCKYTAQVAANISIYKLPKLSFLKTISIDESASVSEDTRRNSCPQTNSSKEALVRQAASDAVEDAKEEFQNFFAPKSYVLERRVREKDSIFKLSKGATAGFAYKSDVTFYHLDKSYNALTKKTTIEEYEVTEGTVSNLIGDEHAWVLVEDAEKANQIMLGDYVKVVYDEGFFGSVWSLAKKAAASSAGDMMGSGGFGGSETRAPAPAPAPVNQTVNEVVIVPVTVSHVAPSRVVTPSRVKVRKSHKNVYVDNFDEDAMEDYYDALKSSVEHMGTFSSLTAAQIQAMTSDSRMQGMGAFAFAMIWGGPNVTRLETAQIELESWPEHAKKEVWAAYGKRILSYNKIFERHRARLLANQAFDQSVINQLNDVELLTKESLFSE